ncbi:MAG: MazG nucleotide pyrophosphohydrolase domain-containing protein [Peptococcaceae bacterium]|nr:MazG nucleotide pyrophosphohydrolase domain-containing protein [Peptococcaceae bacterium]
MTEKKKLIIGGLGPAGAGQISLEVWQKIMEFSQAGWPVILRTKVHPAAEELREEGVDYISCDRYYEEGKDFQQVYQNIAKAVLEETEMGGQALYLVPGHPLVAEETVALLVKSAKERGWETRILSAMSFLDPFFTLIGTDPAAAGFCLLDACRLPESLPENIPLLFTQVYDRFIAGELKLALLEQFDPEAELTIACHAGEAEKEQLISCPLAELDHFKSFDYLTSVYFDGRGKLLKEIRDVGGRAPGSAAELPEKGDPSSGGKGTAAEAGQPAPEADKQKDMACAYPLDPLVQVFDRLLGPGGCPWDKAQTHESLKKYLLEEAGEVLEAIDEGDMNHLKEELGDVLMQVVFHGALAARRQDFDINDIISGVTEKLIRRHPHVFGTLKAANPEEVTRIWQQVKEAERQAKK